MARARRGKKTLPGVPVSENKALRAKGLLPLRWVGSAARLRALGIEVQEHKDAVVRDASGKGIPGRLSTTDREPASYWAARWAVLVVEAEPCNDRAVEWALTRALQDEDFRASLDTIAMMASEDAKGKMADYVMEMWEPEPSSP